MKTTSKRRAALSGLLSGVLAMVLVPAVTASAAPVDGGELVANPDFTHGTTGWRTNKPTQHLSVTSDNTAVLTNSVYGHAVLNDRINTVQDVTEATAYTVTARVRTTTPNVWGALRVREVGPSAVAVSQESFSLKDSSWQTVSMDLTTKYSGSHLDLNVVAWNLPTDKNLQIDSVSMRERNAAPGPVVTPAPEAGEAPGEDSAPAPAPGATPAPEPEAKPAPGENSSPAPGEQTAPERGEAVDECRAEPPAGTVYGSSISTRGQTLAQAVEGIDETFGKVEAIRHFRPGLPLAWDSRNMRLMSDRTLITSFKAHPTEITSGSLDEFFTDWFATAPEDQTIYWSYFHEPEDNINRGEFTASQYRAAWRHLAELEQEACKPNLHSTLILTEWTMQPASKRDYRTYDAGPEYVSVLGFDPYNGVTSLTRDFYEGAEDLLGPLAEKMAADGRPWGIAELGSRQVASDTDGSGRAAWLREVTDFAEEHGARFITYYHSVAKGGDFRLLDDKGNAVWRELVAK